MFDPDLQADWDYEDSIAFAREQAEERGREKVRVKIVTNLIIKADFSDEQIASAVEAPVSFVKR